ncbi:VTT domain-containing protein [Candidatus Nomurabacteria bacterium]|nr:VTT domain-containing protein [Candidatus Nomurabacteria bacterium]
MILSFVNMVTVTVLSFGVAGVFLAGVLEEVVVPIPSALTMMAAGFFFLGGQPLVESTLIVLFVRVAIPLALGLTVGSLFTYWLAWRFGRPVVERFGHYVGISWTDIEGLEKRLEKNRSQSVTIFSLRVFPLLPSVVINIFCGLTRLPFWRYCSITFSGVVIRSYILALVGWQLGSVYHHYARYFEKIEFIGLIIVVFFLVFFYIRRKK